MIAWQAEGADGRSEQWGRNSRKSLLCSRIRSSSPLPGPSAAQAPWTCLSSPSVLHAEDRASTSAGTRLSGGAATAATTWPLRGARRSCQTASRPVSMQCWRAKRYTLAATLGATWALALLGSEEAASLLCGCNNSPRVNTRLLQAARHCSRGQGKVALQRRWRHCKRDVSEQNKTVQRHTSLHAAWPSISSLAARWRHTAPTRKAYARICTLSAT